MIESDQELLRRGIVLVDHLADLLTVVQGAIEHPAIYQELSHLVNRSRDRLSRIIIAANAIED